MEGRFAPFTSASSPYSRALIPHYLRAWNRLVDEEPRRSQRSNISIDGHATLQAVGKERRLPGVLFAALDCTGFVRITMFATARNCFFRLAFLWDHLTAMSYSLFRGSGRCYL